MLNETNPSWELLKQIVAANNKGNYDDMYALIDSNDFSDKAQAADATMACIELIQESVNAHKDCLIKFAEQASCHELSFRSAFRLVLLKDLLGIDSESESEPI